MAFPGPGYLYKALLTALRPAPLPTMESERRQYNDRVAAFRKHEYPMLDGTTYLDHAGTALYSRSLIDAFSAEMMTSLVGNTHSRSTSAAGTAYRIQSIRSRVLSFFRADPEHFDVVFVSNATAAIKLVADAFRGHDNGFRYFYHKDSHTSLVGVRELAAQGSRCLKSDSEVESWLDDRPLHDGITDPPLLFAYPGQSNMNGRRLPLHWPGRLRRSGRANAYSLLDAAALVSTSPLDLSDTSNAPDFVSISFYKIFGFPDLGALIVRKDAAHVFDHRRYFGGGTVEMVTCLGAQWHQMKRASIHERLEDGTLPMRSILALGCAFDAQEKLYGSMEDVSKHTSWLAKILFDRITSLKHGNGNPVCKVFCDGASTYGDAKTQGATVTFNLRDSRGDWYSNHEFNKLASVNGFHIRTGTLCNPGGMADSLDISADDLLGYYTSGFRCGSANDVRDGRVVGMSRVSLGASSTMEDVDRWIEFVKEYFVEKQPSSGVRSEPAAPLSPNDHYVESLTIYPIKSCGGWSIPAGQDWVIRPQGLVWDREWCLVDPGLRDFLSQKRCPKMALLKPKLDLDANLLHVHYTGVPDPHVPSDIFIPLLFDESRFTVSRGCTTEVCGDKVDPRVYASQDITNFFSAHLGTACCLAWLPSSSPSLPHRVAKSLEAPSGEQKRKPPAAGFGPTHSPSPPPSPPHHPILFANESPILTISRASINHLNKSTEAASPAIGPERFRANILLTPRASGAAVAYAEDSWSSIRIIRAPPSRAFFFQQEHQARKGVTELQVLGRCRRCQMVCIDQHTGERCSEPLSALSKTRRWGGGVWFGVHCGLARQQGLEWGVEQTIRVGDWVEGIVREQGGAKI